MLLGKQKLLASLNTYDWLGTGIYFWEHSPHRALEWAIQQSKRKGTKIKEPAVLGAVIQLGNRIDLPDIEFTQMLSNEARELENDLAVQGVSLPTNQTTSDQDFDWLRRDRDCFVLNSVIPRIEAAKDITYHSVRDVFQEGSTAFKGAGIKLKSHIQIAMRDPRAILGYFNPEPT